MKQQMGYTLVELIVVICLLGLMLGFTLPKVENAMVADPFQKTSRTLLTLIRNLKQAAVADQRVYLLNIDLNGNRLWETDETMTEEILQRIEEKGLRLASGVWFSKVTVDGRDAASSGIARIRFYPKGYSDPAEIWIEGEGRKRRGFIVEPFLPQVRMEEQG